MGGRSQRQPRIAPSGDVVSAAGPCSAADAFASALGLRVLQQDRGRAAVEFIADERHVNDLGVVHGGSLFSLGDAALALAANDEDEAAIGVAVSIRFLRSARAGDRLEAHAQEEYRGRRRGVYSARILCGSELIALLEGESQVVGPRARPSAE